MMANAPLRASIDIGQRRRADKPEGNEVFIRLESFLCVHFMHLRTPKGRSCFPLDHEAYLLQVGWYL